MEASKREEIEWAFEQVATDIFQSIEFLKLKMAEFDWHDEDGSGDRDRRFFVLKNEMDSIWAEIKQYRADCWESGVRRECQCKKENKIMQDEKLSAKTHTAIDLTGMSEEKIGTLLHYCDQDPKQFIQYDVFTDVEPGDPIVQPDADSDALFGGATTELMHGTTVRVLVVPGTPQETVIRALRKISEWVEKDPERLMLETYRPHLQNDGSVKPGW